MSRLPGNRKEKKVNSFKQTIRVEDVRPSEVNPREDMGDLDRLAESIKATGGQPVNPICVVRDGDKWRLVDGERRYRAMCKLGTVECDAMVFASYADADEAVAMLATDDKKQLSEEEAARGFQRMLDLGVDDYTIAGVTHRDAEKVKRVRRIAKTAPEQATLDAMFEAADDEFTDEERKTILVSGNLAEWRAEQFRKQHKAARNREAIRAELPDTIEYRPGSKPWNPEKEGLLFLATVKTPKTARKFAGEHEGEGDLVAYEDASAYSLFSFIGEDEMDAKAAAESKQKRMLEEHAEKYDKAFREVMDYLLRPWVCSPDDTLPPRVSRFERKVTEHRRYFDQENFEKFFGDYYNDYADCRPSMAEAMSLIWASHEADGLYYPWNAGHCIRAARHFVELVDMATADGMSPSDNVMDIYDMAMKFMAEEEN